MRETDVLHVIIYIHVVCNLLHSCCVGNHLHSCRVHVCNHLHSCRVCNHLHSCCLCNHLCCVCITIIYIHVVYATIYIKGEYKEMVGDFLPFKKLGFPSLEDFIQSVPDVVELRW